MISEHCLLDKCTALYKVNVNTRVLILVPDESLRLARLLTHHILVSGLSSLLTTFCGVTARTDMRDVFGKWIRWASFDGTSKRAIPFNA